MKVMHKQKIKNSVFFRLFIIVLCVLIPVNLLLLIYSNYLFFSVRNQVYADNLHVLQLYMNQLENEMDSANTMMYRITADSSMMTLRQSDAEHSGDEIEWYANRNRIQLLYAQYIQDYTYVEGIYTYISYPDGNNAFTIYSSAEDSDVHINRDIQIFVKDIIEKELDNQSSIYIWKPVIINDKNYFFLLRKRGNCYFGGWISIDGIIKQWQLDPGVYCFTNDANQSISSFRGNEKNIENGLNKNISVLSKHDTFKLIQVMDDEIIIKSVPVFAIVLFVLTLLSLMIIPIIICISKKYILKPVNRLLDGMEEVADGNLDYKIPESEIGGEFETLNHSFNTMIMEIRDLKDETYEKELERQRIQLKYLSSQIQPHFILNTLNILYSYAEDEFDLIQEMILCLAKYFRYIVNVNAEYVSLTQELEHIRNYFKIQSARYPDLFSWRVTADEDLNDFGIPPLLIQNYVENAIKYSVSNNYETYVRVSAQNYCEDKVQILIEDNGKGMSSDVLDAIQRFRETHIYQDQLGVGIQNAIERLEIMYNGNASIEFYINETGGTSVNIILPYIKVCENEE